MASIQINQNTGYFKIPDQSIKILDKVHYGNKIGITIILMHTYQVLYMGKKGFIYN
jgi:hypothetical protein